MKKNGFIATSLLYAFFLVFISLFIVLLLNFLHNRVLISKINENVRENLTGINNRKISDMNIGDFVKWKNLNPTAKTNPMSENGTWIVAKIDVEGNQKTYYLLSDLLTSVPSVRVSLASDNGLTVPHPMSVSVFNELNAQGGYVSSLKYYENHPTGMTIDIVNAELLEEISRSETIDNKIKRSIFNSGEDYIIKIDNKYTGNGYYTPFNYDEGSMNSYYLYRLYNFDNYQKVEGSVLSEKEEMIKNYCGGYYDYTNDVVDYNYESEGVSYVNPFGYIDVVEDTSMDENNSLVTSKYLDFCYNASPVQYTHLSSDMVVINNETSNEQGDLITSLKGYNHRLRLLMKVTVETTQEDTYLSGGKGISNDPYIITNGVKQS